jgi:hypothetical protein
MNYEAQGGFKIANCSTYSFTKNIITLFYKGDVVYIKSKARRGILEKVSIKKINVVNLYDWNYQDTQNRIWLEYEICGLNEVNKIIENYNINKAKKYIFFINQC